jgi:hypothetical protein
VDDLITWLRALIEADLKYWRDREAHPLAAREYEGDYYYFEARERVAQLEADLAILDEHGDNHDCVDWKGASASPYLGCRTVRLLGYGYKFRDRYREEWKP